MRRLEDHEAAYIAGFVDGEGTITVLKAAQRFLVELSAAQIDKRPLLFLQEKMGGTICMSSAKPGLNKRPTWHYKLCSGARFDFYVPQLLPYLLIKRKKAEIALEMREHIRGYSGKRGRPITIKSDDGAASNRVKTSLSRDEYAARLELVRRAAAEQAMWGLY